MANINPGRYTVQVTVTVLADSRQDAYRQIERYLGQDHRKHGITYVDAEDTKLEPVCANAGDVHDFDSERDVAVDGSDLCAACLEDQTSTFELRADDVVLWTGQGRPKQAIIDRAATYANERGWNGTALDLYRNGEPFGDADPSRGTFDAS